MPDTPLPAGPIRIETLQPIGRYSLEQLEYACGIAQAIRARVFVLAEPPANSDGDDEG